MNISTIIFTHGALAGGFACALDMILGPGHGIRILAFEQGDDLVSKSAELSLMISDGNADFTVVLTDMYGATPTNSALLSICQQPGAAVVSGVNLIMAIQAFELDGEDISPEDALAAIEQAGKTGIKTLTRTMFCE